MKIAICAIIKNENIYLREWVEYHKRLGFDKIILYDNNPIDGEVPHQVIGDYIMDGYVDVHNVRGVPFVPPDIDIASDGVVYLQPLVYTKCCDEYKKDYRWIAFIDVDEFITITPKYPQNIHHLFDIQEYEKNGFEQISMSWYNIGDDSKFYYEDKPIQDRFKLRRNFESYDAHICDNLVKSILKTDTKKDGEIIDIHATKFKNTCIGNCCQVIPGYHDELCLISIPDYDVLYITHYFSKSLTEHLSRQRNLTRLAGSIDNVIGSYKTLNGWSDEHEKILQSFQSYMNDQEKIY